MFDLEATSGKMIAVITLAVIASACQGGGGGGNNQNTGTFIGVDTFEVRPNPVPSGQSPTVEITLSNSGESDARNVSIELFGPGFLANTPQSDLSNTIDLLRAPTENNPSIARTSTISLPSPTIGDNRETNPTLYADLSYNYSTRASTDFRLVSDDRLREQDYTVSDATISNSNAPLSISVEGTTPKVYYEDTPETKSLCLVIRNQGPGVTSLPNRGEDWVRLDAETNGATLTPKTSNNDNEQVNGEMEVKMVGGDNGYQCYNLDANDISNGERNINIQVEAEYRYSEETSTQFTVEGRR
jgi:hypothetical protein